MKASQFIIGCALLLLLPCTALAVPIVAGTATAKQRSSGVNGESLSGSPRTDSIPVGRYGGTVDLAMVVTAGTTATWTGSCEHSSDDTTWVWIEKTTAAGAVTIDVVTYTVSNGTSRTLTVATKMQYIRCTLDDPLDGNGTIVITGNIAPN